jgi:hypothetical protein
MRNIISAFIVLSLIAGNTFAQTGKNPIDSLISNPGGAGERYKAKPYNGPLLFSTAFGTGHRQQGKLYKDTIDLPNPLLYIITFKGSKKAYSANYLSVFVGQRKILNIEIYNQRDSINKYGPEAKNGIMKFTLDKGTELVSLEKLVHKYHFFKQYKKLPVYIDSAMACRRPLYFDPKIIKNVSVGTDNDTGSEFINILTTSKPIRYNPNEHYIRGLSTAL